VEDFDVVGTTMSTRRRIGSLSQTLEMQLPALITVSTDYRPREALASSQPQVRLNNYRGKVFQAFRWNADDLQADPKRLGLAGSPTIVGAGVDVGKVPVQKRVGVSLVFFKDVPKQTQDGGSYGPFAAGDLASGLPEGLLSSLKADGTVGVFDFDNLAKEVLP
jgi:electron transfer flavoprotein beta subunit